MLGQHVFVFKIFIFEITNLNLSFIYSSFLIKTYINPVFEASYNVTGLVFHCFVQRIQIGLFESLLLHYLSKQSLLIIRVIQ